MGFERAINMNFGYFLCFAKYDEFDEIMRFFNEQRERETRRKNSNKNSKAAERSGSTVLFSSQLAHTNP